MTRTRHVLGWRVAAATGAATLVLAGCVAEVPVPTQTAPELTEAAALLEPQSARIVDLTMTELGEADAARDTELFTDRVGGDVITIRGAEYTLAKAEDGPAPTVIPSDMQAVYVSGAESWPRTLVTVTEQAADDVTPVVLLWVQDAIETDYQLRGWAHMIPGATLPAMPGTATGAPQLTMTDSTVEPTPKAAIDDYMELLREGAGSDFNEEFAPDSYRERLFAARKTLTEAAADADGKYVDTVQPDMDGAYAMGTADGGALVFVPVKISSSFTVEDATVSIPDADKPLLDGELDDTVTHEYLDMVVMYLPGPGVDSRPAVVAADHNLVKVSDS